MLAAISTLKLDKHVFGFRKKAKGLEPAFTTQARLLDPAKGRAQVADQPAVDPNDSGLELVRHAVGALQVARPQGCGEAVLGGIGQRKLSRGAVASRLL